MGTLEKAEIEAVPNIEFILIQIALFSRREPSGDFRKLWTWLNYAMLTKCQLPNILLTNCQQN